MLKTSADHLPLVTAVITSYNRANWIDRAIESVLAQDYPNLEIVISDNCSTDNSREVISRFLSDPRIRYSENDTNIGMIANFEKAMFDLAKGDYMFSVSSDDFLTDPRFVSDAVKLVTQHKNVSLIFAKWTFYYEATGAIKPFPAPEYHRNAFRTGRAAFFDFAAFPFFGWGACLINRKLMVAHEIHLSGRLCGDIEINLQLMQLGDVCYIDRDAYAIRFHDTNSSGGTQDADFLIKNRFDLWENVADRYIARFGHDEQIDAWKASLIKKDLLDGMIALLINKPGEAAKLMAYAKVKYPQVAEEIGRSSKLFLYRRLLVPIGRITPLARLLAKLFPGKAVFQRVK